MTAKHLFANAARSYLRALPEGAQFGIDELMVIGEPHGLNRRRVWDTLDVLLGAGEIAVTGSTRKPGAKGGRPSLLYTVINVRPNGRIYAKHNVVREYLREWYEPGDTLTANDISGKFEDASARLQQLAGRGELEKVGKKRRVRGRRLVVYRIVALDTMRRSVPREEKKPPVAALRMPAPTGMWDGLLVSQ